MEMMGDHIAGRANKFQEDNPGMTQQEHLDRLNDMYMTEAGRGPFGVCCTCAYIQKYMYIYIYIYNVYLKFQYVIYIYMYNKNI